MPQIPLPKFTFVCGPPGLGQTGLIRAIVAEDDNVLRMDFSAPVCDMISQLFPDSMPVTVDPLENMHRGVLGYDPTTVIEDELKPVGSISVKELWWNLTDSLRQTFGTNALGLLALRTYRAWGTDGLFERVIFSDAVAPEDPEVFISKFGKENCLAIHLGDLTDKAETTRLDCHHIWLPVRETSTRIALLRKEVCNLLRLDRSSKRRTTF